MARRRRRFNTITIIRTILFVVALLALICYICLKIIEGMFGVDIGVIKGLFIDRLKGVAYSSSDYDGIDVSKHQGVIKWDEVAADPKIKFVYIRATMGKGHKDSRYESNLRGARKAGLPVGSYHFMTSKTSVDEQFADFVRAAKPSKQDLIPMIDVENGFFDSWSKEQLQDSLAKFSALIKKRYGRKPMIYSNSSFYNKMLAPRFNDHIIYIANYGSLVPNLRGDHNHNLWQYSERGHIHGIGEYVDLCRFTNGTTIEDIKLED